MLGPAEMDGDQRLMLYWIDPLDAADRLAAKPKLAGKFYFRYEQQESEEGPTKQAFGRANSALVFQEAQLIDMYSVPFIHLFYADKSFSGQTRGHYPIYGSFRSAYVIEQYICNICNILPEICILQSEITPLYRKPSEYS